MKLTYRTVAAAVTSSLLIAGSLDASAQERNAAQAIEVNIAPQPLSEALNELAEQTNIQFVFYSQIGKGLTAPRVRGLLTPEDALARILANSGLKYEYLDEHTIAIRTATLKVETGAIQVPDKAMPLQVAQSQGTAAAVQSGADAEKSAQPSESDRLAIQEVVVTAQKRVERLQDVPVSVQVINSRALSEQNRNTLEDLTRTIPSVHVGSGYTSDSLFIRGIGSGTNAAFDQSVATFVDDIYRGRSRLSAATFLDLERIEILKGPQSTFFGNNAIAGALNIVSAKPGSQFDAWARVLGGEDEQYAVAGAVSGPINEKFGMRVAATANGGNGWLDNVLTGDTGPEEKNEAARVTFAFQPTDQLSSFLKVEYSKHRQDGNALTLVNCPPVAPIVPNADCAQALGLGTIPIGLDDRDLNSGIPGQFDELRSTESSLTINYQAGNHVFTSVIGYYQFDYEANVGSLLPDPFVTNILPEDYRQFSQELRLSSAAGQPIEYTVGAYFQADTVNFNSEANVPGFSFIASIPGFGGLAPYLPPAAALGFSQDEKIYSLFGSLTWNATDRLELTASLRASQVDKDVLGHLYYGTGTQTYGGFVRLPPDLEPLLSIVIGTPGERPVNRSDKAIMPSAKIQYQLAPSAMTYFSYSRGFKAGGVNGQNGLGNVLRLEYEPEYVDALELGFKSEWFRNRLLLNAAAFYSKYRDLQAESRIYYPDVNLYSLEVGNAASAVSQGVELESQWVASDAFRIGVNVTYLDAHYSEFRDAPPTPLFSAQFPGLPTQDISGEPTIYAPTWSGSLYATLTQQLPRNYRLSTTISPFVTSRYFTAAGDAYSVVEGYTRLDGRISLETPHGHWSVDLIGKNLTDRTIVVAPSVFSAMKEQPRNLALQFRYQW